MIFYRVVTKFFSWPPLMLIRVVNVGNEQPKLEIKQLIKCSCNEILVICRISVISSSGRGRSFKLEVSVKFLSSKSL